MAYYDEEFYHEASSSIRCVSSASFVQLCPDDVNLINIRFAHLTLPSGEIGQYAVSHAGNLTSD